MQHTWIFAFIIINVMLICCIYGQDLSVDIVPVSSKFTGKQDVIINLSYKNKGSKPVLLYEWFLPKGKLFDPLFEVTRDGKPVEYIGPKVKRRAPIAADLISIESDKTISTSVDLSSAYDMTQTGNYVVRFKAYIGSMLSTSNRLLNIDDSVSNVKSKSVLESSAVELFAEGRSNFILDEKARLVAVVTEPTYTFIACTKNRLNLIAPAMISATTYAANSVQYLTKLTLPAKSRYTTWFGTYSAKNLATARNHFNSINTAVMSKPLTFYCDCDTANTFAYVYQNLPYKIHLCPLFWSAPSVGTDSKAGTILHELSHFTVVAGTDDVDLTYGQDGCKDLARRNATAALMNADNHEYFAENHPALN